MSETSVTAVPAAAVSSETALPESSWEEAVRAYETADAENPPEPGGIVFTGSSSIRLWHTLGRDFPGRNVINRGFGGSQMIDSVRYAPRLVMPHQPRLVVVYAGDNDLYAGKTPQRVAENFALFVQKVRDALPATRIAVISVKPSRKLWDMIERIRETNRLLKDFVARYNEEQGEAVLTFIDIAPAMLDDAGEPRRELFMGDGLHLSRRGYQVWADVVRPYLDEAG